MTIEMTSITTARLKKAECQITSAILELNAIKECLRTFDATIQTILDELIPTKDQVILAQEEMIQLKLQLDTAICMMTANDEVYSALHKSYHK